MTANELLVKLAFDGGYIVCSDECSEIEIAEAMVADRMHVDANHFGHILRPKKNWDMMKAAFEHCFNDGPKPNIDDFQ